MIETLEDRVFVIAEAGVNHNGSLPRALEMIEVAAAAGADAVKFQTFIPEALACASAAKADYQRRDGPDDESQITMLGRLALDFDQHIRLRERCRELGIAFLSSPFDALSADFLIDRLGLDTIKLGSGELTNAPLIWRLAARDCALILSTGMADMHEINMALGVYCLGLDGIRPASAAQCMAACQPDRLGHRIALMHCTTAYPCPFDQVNLRAMDTMRDLTGLTVGYSDHTPGIAVSLAAMARGARIIEKHFTLDRDLPGPDHAASMTPAQLRELVQGARQIGMALGRPEKKIHDCEISNAAVARKSIVTTGPVRRGEPFTETLLTTKRPGQGLSPLAFWSLIGRSAQRDYAADEPVDADEIAPN